MANRQAGGLVAGVRICDRTDRGGGEIVEKSHLVGCRHCLHHARARRSRPRADAAALLQHPDLAEPPDRRARLGSDRYRSVRGRRDRARVHLWRVFHRDLPRRLSFRAARPARGGRRLRHDAVANLLADHVPADDAFRPPRHRQ
ncbi:Histidine ABC transporter, permease protein HisM [Caballeronia sordidicola]|uniref:Histidine ABC transporter, permease protein HisM n=1 Tax=Caballeronia sordidicola TaxID=196367 RepID=A0A242N4E4_CABSO|nr:Histidine ABC transporter, permease protein HisM [Caballeronia sordidicola]